MILVEAPTDTQPEGDTANPADVVQQPATVIGSSFDQVDDLLAEPGPPDNADLLGQDVASDTHSAEGMSESETDSAVSETAAETASHVAPLVSRWLIVGIGSFVGVALAVGGLGYGLARLNTPPVETVTAAEPISLADSEEVSWEAEALPNQAERIGEEEASTNSAAVRRPDHESDDEASQDDLDVIDIPAHKTRPSADSTALVQTSPQVDPVTPPEFIASDPAPHTVRRVPTGLEGFASLLEDAPLQPESATEPPQDDGSPSLDESSKVVEADGEKTGLTTPHGSAAVITPPRTIDITARLADKLHRADFRALPLVDFLRTVTQLSTIPIALDPEGLAYLNLDPNVTVTLQQTDTSVAELLDAALRPLKMTYVRHSDHLVATSASIARDDLTTHAFRVADLTGGDAGQRALLGRWVVQFIEPATWEELGGTGKLELADDTLKITQVRRVHFKVLLFLEKLRRVRGLPLQSRIGESRVPLVPRWQQLSPQLHQEVSIKVWHPEPILSVVARLEEAARIRLLIDWRSLAMAGFSPETELTLVADGKPVEKGLGQLLDPLQLTYRPIDERTIQITSAEAAAMQRYVELYPLDGADALQRIKQTIAQSSGAGDFAIDETSQTALVLLPSKLHRQLVSE